MRRTATTASPRPASDAATTERVTPQFPQLLTVDETARLLRTSRAAVYAMSERGLLPGVIRIGRRLLLDSAALIDWLNQKRAPSPQE
jgi:excisionase family DNA binding protein